MAWTFRINPSDSAPIWRQIEEGVRYLVAVGALVPGSPVPSVRELSKGLQVNPATVVRAYQRLTDTGVLTVRRGEGTFVALTLPPVLKGEQQRGLAEAARRYATAAVTLGVEREDAVNSLRAEWDDVASGGQGEDE